MPTAISAFPERTSIWGPATRTRLARTAFSYITVCMIAAGANLLHPTPGLSSLTLGLIVPGGGWLLWSGTEGVGAALAIGGFVATALAFLIAIVIWFATGNVILPLVLWFGSALGIAYGGEAGWLGRLGNESNSTTVIILGSMLALAVFCSAAVIYLRQRGLRRRSHLNKVLQSADRTSDVQVTPRDTGTVELKPSELRLLRLLLDRSLQSTERFEGFEWRDQFQTAAVRYQLCFMSYGLSVIQRNFAPAFHGYLTLAQENLARKQLDHRIWGYWRLENLWGNFRMDADPIPHDNIMLSGFLAAQIAGFRNASGRKTFDTPGSLVFEHPKGRQFPYSYPEIIHALVCGYRQAPFGLLACEPNWIFPLCNFITASAVQAFDAVNSSNHWEEIAPVFRESLENEFIDAGGRLVPCRSSYTGVALPPIGGAIMQTLPCLFLNAILKDVAHRQWSAFRNDTVNRDITRMVWPIDVGNYQFSRASGYVATAAAAAELGDGETAELLLSHLDDECPAIVRDGVAHRPAASLWTHAVELMARCGGTDTYRRLITEPVETGRERPFIKDAQYPEVLVAAAHNSAQSLSAILYPGAGSGFKALTIGGLAPDCCYTIKTAGQNTFNADKNGEARINLPIHGRTEVLITRSS